MTLLLPEARLDERRRAAEGPLAPLADALRAELAPLLAGEPYIPEAKARLTRAGGRCPRDGAQLDFDPGERSRLRCPRCGVGPVFGATAGGGGAGCVRCASSRVVRYASAPVRCVSVG